MVKVQSGIKTGAHPETLIRIYKALFRSVLEYGCIVHCNAKASNRQMLSVVNNQCLRKITGATRTTPLNMLAALSGQEPVELRQQLVAAKEIVRCFARNNIIAKQLQQVILPENHDDWDRYSYAEQLFWKHRDIFNNICQE